MHFKFVDETCTLRQLRAARFVDYGYIDMNILSNELQFRNGQLHCSSLSFKILLMFHVQCGTCHLINSNYG